MFLDYRQSFKIDNTVAYNNEMNQDCGPSLKGVWDFKKGPNGDPFEKISSPDIPKLLNTD